MEILLLKVIVVSFAFTETSCSIGGLNYMDPINQRPLPNDARRKEGGDPCNPLYWYPRAVPEYCNQKFSPPCGPSKPSTTPSPIPVPIPVPSVPFPYPIPFPPPLPMPHPLPPPPMPMPYPLPPPMPMPHPLPPPPMPMPYPLPPPPPPPPMIPMAIPPLPYGIPIMPAGPMLPVGGLPLPAFAPFPGMFPAQFPAPPLSPASFGPQVGLMPGIRGMVSPDGGINIMPFSDAYSTMLEEHRQKMIRKHLEHVLKRYGERVNYGRRRKSRRW